MILQKKGGVYLLRKMNHRMKNIFLLIFILCSSICCGETQESLEKEAEAKLDRSIEHLQLSVLGFSLGLLEFFRGSPISGAVAIGGAITEVKTSVCDFLEACELSEQARGMDPESWGNREYDRH